MVPFTEAELEYLASQPLGRVATSSADGQADVAPVTFELDGGVIVIGGMDVKRTLKHRNVVATGKAAFVVDDLATVNPWRPRSVKVHGAASVVDRGGKPVIRIEPTTVWSWGINTDAPKHFGGIVEKRTS
jgi:pyridoxamine 5'-phosphate oxidase family protein